MALRAHRFKGLNADVLLPDDIEVTVDIVPDSKIGWVRSGTRSSGQTRTTYHNTGNSGSTAMKERNYLHGGPMGRNQRTGELERRLVGFNFAVDDKRIIQLTPLDEVTWAAGTVVGNDTSWHVEHCYGGAINWEKSLRNAIALHAGLIAAKGWDADHALVRHNHWKNKHCPAQILDKGLWPSVQRQVGEAARAASGGGGGDGGGGAPTFADPVPIPELAAFRDHDANTIPAVVTVADGSPFYFVNDRVKATRETPRLQLANPDSERVGPDLQAGQEFDVLWIFTSSADDESYYVTPHDTRVKVEDTARLGSSREREPAMDGARVGFPDVPGPEGTPEHETEDVFPPDFGLAPGGEAPGSDAIQVDDEEVMEAPGH